MLVVFVVVMMPVCFFGLFTHRNQMHIANGAIAGFIVSFVALTFHGAVILFRFLFCWSRIVVVFVVKTSNSRSPTEAAPWVGHTRAGRHHAIGELPNDP